jgi:hypothetical protein
MQVLTTEAFAAWFAELDGSLAEDVATAIDLVEQLGIARAAPGSREALLWYEHPSVASFTDPEAAAWDFDAWGSFHEEARRVLQHLESPRFTARFAQLAPAAAFAVTRALRELRAAADPRTRWTAKVRAVPGVARPQADPSASLRRLHGAVLEAAGLEMTELPAHSLALRELARRQPAPGFRLLYGVHEGRETALFVLGERLGRSFYGDSVRRAERLWAQFLEGSVGAHPPPQSSGVEP